MLEAVHTSVLDVHAHGKTVRSHVEHWVDNPDPGSNFDKQIWFRHYLPTWLLVEILFWIGYEGLIFLDELGAVVGHVFFQKHGTSLHAFHWYIQPEERGHHHMQEISNAFFEYAREKPSIARVRIGAGGNPRIARLWESIRDEKIIPSCGLKAGEQMGWLFFPERLAC